MNGRLRTPLGLLYKGAAPFSWFHLLACINKHFGLILNVFRENYWEKKSSEKIRNAFLILIFESSVLFVPYRFGCPLTHLKFKVTFMEKFPRLSNPYDESLKTWVLWLKIFTAFHDGRPLKRVFQHPCFFLKHFDEKT